eukprot:scaffold79484_cov60-Phaeocystis_antarctica.AAC.2
MAYGGARGRAALYSNALWVPRTSSVYQPVSATKSAPSAHACTSSTARWPSACKHVGGGGGGECVGCGGGGGSSSSSSHSSSSTRYCACTSAPQGSSGQPTLRPPSAAGLIGFQPTRPPGTSSERTVSADTLWCASQCAKAPPRAASGSPSTSFLPMGRGPSRSQVGGNGWQALPPSCARACASSSGRPGAAAEARPHAAAEPPLVVDSLRSRHPLA